MQFKLLLAILLLCLTCSARGDQVTDLTEAYDTGDLPSYDAASSALRGVLGGGLFVGDRSIGKYERRSTLPILLMSYGDWTYWTVTGGGVWLTDGALRSGFGVRLRPGWKPDNDPFLDGMDERKGTLDGSVNLLWRTRIVNLRASYYHDLLGVDNGSSATIRLSRSLRVRPRWFLTPTLDLEWQSGKLIDNYYGVRSHEALPTRPEYSGSPSHNLKLGITSTYLTADWCLLGAVRGTYFGDGVANSPIVSDRTPTLIFIGLGFWI